MIPLYKPHLPAEVGAAMQSAIAEGQINHEPGVSGTAGALAIELGFGIAETPFVGRAGCSEFAPPSARGMAESTTR